MRVLVTGASGLIGSALVDRLCDGHEVYGLVRSRERAPRRLLAERTIVADLAAEWASSGLPASLDAIVHLAQSENFRDFPGGARSMFKVNVESTTVLLDHARHAGVKSFLLASTGGLYVPSESPVGEQDPIACDGPLEYYLRTRHVSEELARGYARLFLVLAMRFFFVYGPGQRESMLFPRLARSVREGTPIRLDGTDGVRMNPLHVEDAVSAVMAALDGDVSGTMNFAGPEVLSLRDVGNTLGEAIGRKPSFEMTGAAAASRIGSIERLRAIFEPRIRLRDRAASLVSA